MNSVKPPMPSLMLRETLETPLVIDRQLLDNTQLINSLASKIRQHPPKFMTMCGRGSSGHACKYGKFLIERYLKIPVNLFNPSMATLYNAKLNLNNSYFFVVSQSGKSPDLLASAQLAKACGAFVVAVVNSPGSPLGDIADLIIPMRAKTENSIAATKSFISSLSVFADFVFTTCKNDQAYRDLREVPQHMLKNGDDLRLPSLHELKTVERMFVIGRGANLPVAYEAALKLKETCAILAQTFSAAEVQHGPMTIAHSNFTILGFEPNDKARISYRETLDLFISREANCYEIGGHKNKELTTIPCDHTIHPDLLPLLQVQTFYVFANQLSILKGLHPDQPTYLKKVTETV